MNQRFTNYKDLASGYNLTFAHTDSQVICFPGTLIQYVLQDIRTAVFAAV